VTNNRLDFGRLYRSTGSRRKPANLFTVRPKSSSPSATRFSVVVLLALGVTLSATTTTPAAPPQGQLTWAVQVGLAPAWFDPAEATGILIPFMVYYALHDALVNPTLWLPEESRR